MILRPIRTLVVALVTLGLVPAAAVAQGTIEYYHLDAIGNVRVVTDAAGTVLERHDYLPFGEECTTAPCAPAGAGARKFTGKERDAESGLDYFGARYYGSKIGRFTTIDPAYTIKENIVDPQRWNRYAYGRNNPWRFVDPDGRETVDLGIGFVEGLGNIGLSTPNLIMALATSPVATVRNAVQDAKFLGQGLGHPSTVVDAYVQLAVSRNDADQRALGTAFGESTAVAAMSAVTMAGAGARPAVGGDWAQLSGMLRAAARGKGNFGIGAATLEQTEAMGRAWVGEGATSSGGGRILTGELRQYRAPTFKPRLGRVQANLEGRAKPGGAWQSNAHIDVTTKQ